MSSSASRSPGGGGTSTSLLPPPTPIAGLHSPPAHASPPVSSSASPNSHSHPNSNNSLGAPSGGGISGNSSVGRRPAGPLVPPLPLIVSELREEFLVLLQSLEEEDSFTCNVYVVDLLLTLAHLDVHLRVEERRIFMWAYDRIMKHLLAKVESMRRMVAKVVFVQALLESLALACESLERALRHQKHSKPASLPLTQTDVEGDVEDEKRSEHSPASRRYCRRRHGKRIRSVPIGAPLKSSLLPLPFRSLQRHRTATQLFQAHSISSGGGLAAAPRSSSTSSHGSEHSSSSWSGTTCSTTSCSGSSLCSAEQPSQSSDALKNTTPTHHRGASHSSGKGRRDARHTPHESLRHTVSRPFTSTPIPQHATSDEPHETPQQQQQQPACFSSSVFRYSVRGGRLGKIPREEAQKSIRMKPFVRHLRQRRRKHRRRSSGTGRHALLERLSPPGLLTALEEFNQGSSWSEADARLLCDFFFPRSKSSSNHSAGSWKNTVARPTSAAVTSDPHRGRAGSFSAAPSSLPPKRPTSPRGGGGATNDGTLLSSERGGSATPLSPFTPSPQSLSFPFWTNAPKVLDALLDRIVRGTEEVFHRTLEKTAQEGEAFCVSQQGTPNPLDSERSSPSNHLPSPLHSERKGRGDHPPQKSRQTPKKKKREKGFPEHPRKESKSNRSRFTGGSPSGGAPVSCTAAPSVQNPSTSWRGEVDGRRGDGADSGPTTTTTQRCRASSFLLSELDVPDVYDHLHIYLPTLRKSYTKEWRRLRRAAPIIPHCFASALYAEHPYSSMDSPFSALPRSASAGGFFPVTVNSASASNAPAAGKQHNSFHPSGLVPSSIVGSRIASPWITAADVPTPFRYPPPPRVGLPPPSQSSLTPQKEEEDEVPAALKRLDPESTVEERLRAWWREEEEEGGLVDLEDEEEKHRSRTEPPAGIGSTATGEAKKTTAESTAAAPAPATTTTATAANPTAEESKSKKLLSRVSVMEFDLTDLVLHFILLALQPPPLPSPLLEEQRSGSKPPQQHPLDSAPPTENASGDRHASSPVSIVPKKQKVFPASTKTTSHPALPNAGSATTKAAVAMSGNPSKPQPSLNASSLDTLSLPSPSSTTSTPTSFQNKASIGTKTGLWMSATTPSPSPSTTLPQQPSLGTMSTGKKKGSVTGKANSVSAGSFSAVSASALIPAAVPDHPIHTPQSNRMCPSEGLLHASSRKQQSRTEETGKALSGGPPTNPVLLSLNTLKKPTSSVSSSDSSIAHSPPHLQQLPIASSVGRPSASSSFSRNTPQPGSTVEEEEGGWMERASQSEMLLEEDIENETSRNTRIRSVTIESEPTPNENEKTLVGRRAAQGKGNALISLSPPLRPVSGSHSPNLAPRTVKSADRTSSPQRRRNVPAPSPSLPTSVSEDQSPEEKSIEAAFSLLQKMRLRMRETAEQVRRGLTPLRRMQQQLRGEIALLTFRVISTIVDWLIPGVSAIDRPTWLFYRFWLCDLYAHLYSLDLLPTLRRMMALSGAALPPSSTTAATSAPADNVGLTSSSGDAPEEILSSRCLADGEEEVGTTPPRKGCNGGGWMSALGSASSFIDASTGTPANASRRRRLPTSVAESTSGSHASSPQPQQRTSKATLSTPAATEDGGLTSDTALLSSTGASVSSLPKSMGGKAGVRSATSASSSSSVVITAKAVAQQKAAAHVVERKKREEQLQQRSSTSAAGGHSSGVRSGIPPSIAMKRKSSVEPKEGDPVAHTTPSSAANLPASSARISSPDFSSFDGTGVVVVSAPPLTMQDLVVPGCNFVLATPSPYSMLPSASPSQSYTGGSLVAPPNPSTSPSKHLPLTPSKATSMPPSEGSDLAATTAGKRKCIATSRLNNNNSTAVGGTSISRGTKVSAGVSAATNARASATAKVLPLATAQSHTDERDDEPLSNTCNNANTSLCSSSADGSPLWAAAGSSALVTPPLAAPPPPVVLSYAEESVRVAMSLLDRSSTGFSTSTSPAGLSERGSCPPPPPASMAAPRGGMEWDLYTRPVCMMTRLVAAAVRGMDREAVRALSAAFLPPCESTALLPSPQRQHPSNAAAPGAASSHQTPASHPRTDSSAPRTATPREDDDQHYHAFHYPPVHRASDVVQLYHQALHDAELILNPHDPLRATMVLHAAQFLAAFSEDIAMDFVPSRTSCLRGAASRCKAKNHSEKSDLHLKASRCRGTPSKSREESRTSDSPPSPSGGALQLDRLRNAPYDDSDDEEDTHGSEDAAKSSTRETDDDDEEEPHHCSEEREEDEVACSVVEGAAATVKEALHLMQVYLEEVTEDQVIGPCHQLFNLKTALRPPSTTVPPPASSTPSAPGGAGRSPGYARGAPRLNHKNSSSNSNHIHGAAPSPSQHSPHGTNEDVLEDDSGTPHPSRLSPRPPLGFSVTDVRLTSRSSPHPPIASHGGAVFSVTHTNSGVPSHSSAPNSNTVMKTGGSLTAASTSSSVVPVLTNIPSWRSYKEQQQFLSSLQVLKQFYQHLRQAEASKMERQRVMDDERQCMQAPQRKPSGVWHRPG